MRERPIIFNSEMVKAILDGRKTTARRLKGLEWLMSYHYGHPICDWALSRFISCENGLLKFEIQTAVDDSRVYNIKCPYGQPGDKLWVRETWATMKIHDSKAPSHIQYSTDPRIWYMADSPPKWDTQCDPWPKGNMGKIRSSIHMPRWASRIALDITDIRVERLQEITEDDADAEIFGGDFPSKVMPELFNSDEAPGYSIPECFARYWDSLYIKKPESQWNTNPWIWVIDFDNSLVQL